MRALVFLCLLAAVYAQYQYTAQTPQLRPNNYAASNNADSQSSNNVTPTVYDSGYNKEFYSYSAPEEDFDDVSTSKRLSEVMKKNLRVVFIKSPENNALENAVVQLANTAADQRTQIYVLNKQTDIADLANRLNDLQQQNKHKPDVHFVKYRTQADAALAQQAIQAQYNTLPGATATNNNVGIANVLDFSGSAAGESAQRGDQPARTTGTNGYNPAQAASYLPPGRRYKK